MSRFSKLRGTAPNGHSVVCTAFSSTARTSFRQQNDMSQEAGSLLPVYVYVGLSRFAHRPDIIGYNRRRWLTIERDRVKIALYGYP